MDSLLQESRWAKYSIESGEFRRCEMVREVAFGTLQQPISDILTRQTAHEGTE